MLVVQSVSPGPLRQRLELLSGRLDEGVDEACRIAYRGLIDNIQVSWVKMGADGVRQALLAGVNDLGGTLMDENISRAAGAAHGQLMEEAEFRAIVEPLGRRLEQRTTLYGRTRTDPAPVPAGS